MLLCLLIVVCIIASSSITFSAMPQGKFPIEIFSSRETPNQLEEEFVNILINNFNNSPKYRVTNINENRIILTFLLNKHVPGIASTDVFATASPIYTFSLIWVAKPQNTHGYIIWHDSGSYRSYNDLAHYILQQADVTVRNIKRQYPNIFN